MKNKDVKGRELSDEARLWSYVIVTGGAVLAVILAYTLVMMFWG